MKPLVVIACVLTIAAKAPLDPGPRPSDAAAISDAETAVRAQLKDENSAQFRYLEEPLRLGKNGWFVCGQVNARNSFGGYPGYASFVVYMHAGQEMRVKVAPVGLGYNECFKPSLAPAA